MFNRLEHIVLPIKGLSQLHPEVRKSRSMVEIHPQLGDLFSPGPILQVETRVSRHFFQVGRVGPYNEIPLLPFVGSNRDQEFAGVFLPFPVDVEPEDPLNTTLIWCVYPVHR